MAKVKIIKKELVWDVFDIEDNLRIGIVENSACCLDKKVLKKMYSIVSAYYDYTYEQFCEQAKYFIISVGKYDFCDYYSIKELKAYRAFSPEEIFFYAVVRNKWNMIEVEADYFSIQGTDGYDRPFTKAIYQDYNSAIRYCLKNNVDIDNIVPQEWGEYIPLFD